MDGDGEAIVRRARAIVGARFRPQGREPGSGLDCVGLAILALGLPKVAVAADYALRGNGLERLAAELRRHGLEPVASSATRPGDLAVFAPARGQLHLAIMTGTTMIHADAALRRAVERPLPAPWPLVGVWRRAVSERAREV